jgi:6-pyruvoyltetrahydropterin/6-carboxytetrahydropterin synthase
MITATRFHDFSMGHKVTGHENKCAHLHGHNYRIHFTLRSVEEQDALGRVIDFSVIKSKLCEWLEENWDHKMMLWEHEPLAFILMQEVPQDIVLVDFNPTAENMAKYLCEEVAVEQLAGTGCVLIKCVIEETRKCLATYEIGN